MGVVRVVGIASFVIIAGFLFTQGLGTDYGIIQEINNFEDDYPTDPQEQCDWREKGVLTNLRVAGDCDLIIKNDQENAATNFTITRFSVDTESGWQNSYNTRDNFVTETSQELGAYITPTQTLEEVEEPLGVKYDHVETVSTGFSGNDQITTQVNTSGDNRLLVVAVSFYETGGIFDPAGTSVDSITYDGESMNLADSLTYGSETQTNIYYLTNTSLGENTLDVEFAQSLDNGALSAAVFNDVDQGSPFDTVQSNTASGSNPSTISVGTETENIVYDVIASAQSVSPGSGQNARFTSSISGSQVQRGSTKDVNGLTEMSWTGSGTKNHFVLDIDSETRSLNISQYFTTEFRVSNQTPLNVFYRYNDSGGDVNGDLQLFRPSTGNVVSSTSLLSGSADDNYEQAAAFTVPETDDYEFRIVIDEGDYQEEKFMSLDAVQDSEGVENVSSGVYQSSRFNTVTEIEFSDLRFTGDENQTLGDPDAFQGNLPIQVEFQGINNQQVVATETFRVTDGSTFFEGDIFPNTEINAYSFKATIFKETVESEPVLESVSISGRTFEREFPISVSDNLRTALFVIFLAMALSYVAWAAGRRTG